MFEEFESVDHVTLQVSTLCVSSEFTYSPSAFYYPSPEQNLLLFYFWCIMLSVLPPPRHAYTTTPTNNHPAPRVDHTVSLNTFSPILSRHSTKRKDVIPTNNVQQIQIARLNAKIPPYGQRSGYVPREPEDFGDGGAFPEIHIKQYPLDMGRKNVQKSTSGQVALRVNEKGEVQYDAILRENMRKDQIVECFPFNFLLDSLYSKCDFLLFLLYFLCIHSVFPFVFPLYSHCIFPLNHGPKSLHRHYHYHQSDVLEIRRLNPQRNGRRRYGQTL